MNETARAKLLPFPEKENTAPIVLSDEKTTVGRAPSNIVQLTQGGVSRSHAVISRENGRYVLTDLKSRNGTFVNNHRIRQAVLQHSDKILFGQHGFMFSLETDTAETASADADIDSVSGDTITISAEELELSKLLSHSAETAISNFFEPLPPGDQPADQAKQDHRRLSFLYQLSENLRTLSDTTKILEKGLELIFEALPSVKRAAAMLRSEPAGTLEVRAAKYRDPETDDAVIPVSRSVLRQVVEDRVAIVSQDAKDDARFDNTEAFVIEDINSFVCVPLMQRERVIGAIYLDTDDHLNPFVQNDMEYTAAVANELALSIDNCRLQRQAIQNEKVSAIGLTITNLAHNIKNLLAFNRSAVDMMDQQLQESEDADLQTNWQMVRQGIDRIADLTADMLDYTQVRDDTVEPIDINKAVVSACDLLQASLSNEGIQVEQHLAADLPPREMNEPLLQRAILNLAANAKDALKGRPDGRIRISTEIDDSARLLIRVEDNGCGIAKGSVNDIFELFCTSKGMEGSGVGLAMVKKFVETMGGKVSVTSQIEIGSIFTLTFPPPAGDGEPRQR